MRMLRTGNARQAADTRRIRNNTGRSRYHILAEDGETTGEVGHR